MKIIAILGSPREKGNTALLLDKFIEGAKSGGAETELVHLSAIDMNYCTECNECDETGTCVIDDDITRVYAKIDSADILALASPIYFATVSAQTKTLIDRAQDHWVRTYVKKKARPKSGGGVFLACGGWKNRKFFDIAKVTVEVFFKSLGIDYAGELYAGGVDKAGDIAKHKDILEEAYSLGRRIVNENKR